MKPAASPRSLTSSRSPRNRFLLALLGLSLGLIACQADSPGAGPPAPSQLAAVAGDAQITLTWAASPGTVAGYRVYRGEEGAALEPLAEVAADDLTYVDDDVVNHQTYSYQLAAFDAEGRESTRTPAVTATPLPKQAPDTTPPTVTGFEPPDGATDVSTNHHVAIDFSEPMDREATLAAVSLDPAVACSWAWSDASERLACVPADGLAQNTLYTLSVGEQATDLAGNPIAPISSSFTTGAEVLPACVFGASASRFGACIFGK